MARRRTTATTVEIPAETMAELVERERSAETHEYPTVVAADGPRQRAITVEVTAETLRELVDAIVDSDVAQ